MEEKLKKMAEGLCEVLDDVGLISFIAMNIQDGETVNRVLSAIDRANGYRSFLSPPSRALLISVCE